MEALNPSSYGSRLKVSISLAFLLHGLAFITGSLSMATQAEYGMASSAANGGQPNPAPQVQETVDLEDSISEDVPIKKRAVPTPIPKPQPPQSAGGAGTGRAYEIPAYYQNPPPPYPEEARRLKQEGTVLLRAEVDSQGKVASVSLARSSGFSLLDESARSTIEKWLFKPARMAGIAVSTTVEIPVQFELTTPR